MKTNRQALVFGATGFIGRWLTKDLLDQGIPTTAAVRDRSRAEFLSGWLTDRGANLDLFDTVLADLAAVGIGLSGNGFSHISEIYNVAGAYAFGMTPETARAANVDTSQRVVEFAATIPGVHLIHLSGYRVGGQDPAAVPWPAQKRQREYKRLGAYEASKVESDALVQARAGELGVSVTVANPASVIGHSGTGESDQVLGLATTVLDLIAGKLPAIPGDSRTFVPVVAVDYLARFMSLLPAQDETRGKSYWILDDNTPALPELLALIARHHGVNVPRFRVPVQIIRRLPRAITKADPETLSFLSPQRYPTGPADEFAQRHGLMKPDVKAALTRWSDHLLASTSTSGASTRAT